MKANKLRIGNYISNRYKRSFSVIDGIYCNKHGKNVIWVDAGIRKPHEVLPLKLTEEWFMLLGFTTDGVVWEKDGFVIGNYASGYFYVPIPYQIANSVGKKLKHVHQLQNLYFAIKGKELALSEIPMRSKPCPNCGEIVKECACMQNICRECGRPVGNITFTVCDNCWDNHKNK